MGCKAGLGEEEHCSSEREEVPELEVNEGVKVGSTGPAGGWLAAEKRRWLSSKQSLARMGSWECPQLQNAPGKQL